MSSSVLGVKTGSSTAFQERALLRKTFSHGEGHGASGARGCLAFPRVRRPSLESRGGARAEGVTAAQAFRKFLPFFDQVLVERRAAETVSKPGIMLPEKSIGKVLQALVMVVGSGSVKGGEIQPVSVKVGDKVLLREYGGTTVASEDKNYFLFRNGDILGKHID
ncbi:10 kDa heat shock protein, mitochondrial-like [Nycticebus coucang]|uniref:10 kDa heat shock protein, mitochondrial-like n=1 Tax=Nycticebus coucang TaxID=9470 RepID=UPI00234C297E|nr:10 kDa heat shock protein, mitochondrial-like [Nycticebus coucang]